MSNGPGVSSNFAGRDVILVHHHGAFQKPRLNFFQLRTRDAKWVKFSRRAQRSLDLEEPALRPPAKTGTSAALHESAPWPTRYPACLAQPATRSRRRGQRVTQRALRGAGDERGGGAGGGSGGDAESPRVHTAADRPPGPAPVARVYAPSVAPQPVAPRGPSRSPQCRARLSHRHGRELRERRPTGRAGQCGRRRPRRAQDHEGHGEDA